MEAAAQNLPTTVIGLVAFVVLVCAILVWYVMKENRRATRDFMDHNKSTTKTFMDYIENKNGIVLQQAKEHRATVEAILKAQT